MKYATASIKHTARQHNMQGLSKMTVQPKMSESLYHRQLTIGRRFFHTSR